MAINVQGLQGHWDQMKNEIKKRWGQLTEDDLSHCGDNIDECVTRIHERTGESKESIEQYLGHLANQSGSAVCSAVEAVGSYAQHLSHRFRDGYGHLSAQAHGGYVSVRDYVGRNPIQWLSIAFGVGVLTGMMVRGARHEKPRRRRFF